LEILSDCVGFCLSGSMVKPPHFVFYAQICSNLQWRQ
jgi:hypothetical protein